MVVFTTPDRNGFGDLAGEIADDRGDRVVRNVDRIDEGEPVLVVADSEELSDETALFFQRRLLEAGPTEGRFSIITGFTPDSARALYERESRSSGQHCLLMPQEDQEYASDDEDVTVLTRKNATVPELEALNERRLESLSAAMAAFSIHTYVTGGAICGVPTKHSVTDFEPPYPSCIEDGEMNCPLDKDLLHADQLEIPHVFLSSCLSMLPGNDVHGLPVHAGMNLLENAVSLVGPYHSTEMRTSQPILHARLLRAGYDTVERCYLLLRHAHALSISNYPFLPFGRPDATVSKPAPQEYDATIEDGESTFLTVSDVDADVVDVTVPRDAVDGTENPLLLNRTDEHADTSLYYVTFEEDDGIRVLVYSDSRIEADAIRFELVGRSETRREYERLASSLHNANALRELGIIGGDVDGHVTNLSNHVSGFEEHFRWERSHANAYRDTREQLGHVQDVADTVRDGIRKALDNREPNIFANDYITECLSVGMDVSDDPCDFCGRPVFDRFYRTLSGDATRVVGTCPHCVVTYDAPVFGDREYAHPYVGGEVEFTPGTTSTVELTFENPLDERMEAEYFMWFCASDETHAAPIFEPDVVSYTLDPGEEAAASFEVDPPENLPESNYTLYGYVIGNLDVYLNMKTIHRTV